jgi:hypothetical protein
MKDKKIYFIPNPFINLKWKKLRKPIDLKKLYYEQFDNKYKDIPSIEDVWKITEKIPVDLSKILSDDRDDGDDNR